MPDLAHQCRCRVCAPEAFPSGPRQGEHHFAVRFGDGRLPIWVTLDGTFLPNCTEASAGRDGWAVTYGEERGEPHGCKACWSGKPCETTVRGVVTVSTERPSGALRWRQSGIRMKEEV